MAFAFVRNLRTSSGANIKDFAQIQSAEAHAKRQDWTSKNRQEVFLGHHANYAWSKVGMRTFDGGADYADAFREHKRQMGVKSERKGAALAQHLLVGVSPEWLAETGDPKDLKNPRVLKLIEQAKEWAESWMGEGAVWAVRYDTDEKGAGVVDILASPVRENRAGRGQPKPQISVNKALKELQDSVPGAANSYEAMQTHWAAWAQTKLDPALERGVPKEITQIEHLNPEAFKELAEARQSLSEARRGIEEAQIEVTALRAERERLEALTEAQSAALEEMEAEEARRKASMTPDLKAENAALQRQLDQRQRFMDHVRSILSDALGSRWQALNDRINSTWADRIGQVQNRGQSTGPRSRS